MAKAIKPAAALVKKVSQGESYAGERSYAPEKHFDIREHLAGDLRRGLVGADPEAMMRHVEDCAAVGPAEAAEHVERFVDALQRDVARRGRVRR